MTRLQQDLHVYCDASNQAIGCVIYLRILSEKEELHVAFVSSSLRVPPRCATSIPRLELCAAVESVRGFKAVTIFWQYLRNIQIEVTDITLVLR